MANGTGDERRDGVLLVEAPTDDTKYEGDKPKEGEVILVDRATDELPTAGELREAGYVVPDSVEDGDRLAGGYAADRTVTKDDDLAVQLVVPAGEAEDNSTQTEPVETDDEKTHSQANAKTGTVKKSTKPSPNDK